MKRTLDIFNDFATNSRLRDVFLISLANSALTCLSSIRKLRNVAGSEHSERNPRGTASNVTRQMQYPTTTRGSARHKNVSPPYEIPSCFDHLREKDATFWVFQGPQGRARYPDPGHRRTWRYRVRIIFLPSFFSLFFPLPISFSFLFLSFFSRHTRVKEAPGAPARSRS